MLKIKKRELFQSILFWIIAIALLLALSIIIFGNNIFDSLASLSLRLLIGFSIFFGTLMAILIFKLYAKEDMQAKLKASKDQRSKENLNSDVIATKVKEIKNRFIEATKIIKNSSVYKGQRDAKYELPWYLIIGEQNEGKTTLLESSGLDFPLNINYQNQPDSPIGQDALFQWYFAEHAIFVDVPGKFIKQEEGSVDAGVWRGFLHLFKKRRWKRPINGVVLTLSVETLMEKTALELELYAKGLRDRFDELSEAFTSTIPIYLLITKTDKIPGFHEYFSTLSENEKDEILGMTFDDSKNIDSIGAQAEFDALIKRLDSSIIDRIQHEWDTSARSKILLFCDEFTILFDKLKTFIDIGFAQTRYRAPLMLRGIYFTSVPNHDIPTAGSTILSRGLFIRKVLQEVIFAEAHVIKMDSGHRIKEKIRERIGIAIATGVVLFVSSLWLWNYNIHENTINKLEKALVEYKKLQQNTEQSDEFVHNLNLLNQVYTIKMVDDSKSSQHFWNLSYYKVKERQEKLENLYYSLLKKIMLSQVAETLQSQTVTNLNNYDETWENTKAYLMLNNQEKRDKHFMLQWMQKIWAHQYPNDMQLQKNLASHWNRLLEHGFKPYALDQNTVQIARNKLAGYGQDALLYKQLKDKVQEMNLKDFNFASIMGSNAVLFSGNDYIIPGFYTKSGYQKVFTLDGKVLLKEIIRSNWVLGYSTELKNSELDIVYEKIQNYYFADYKKIWIEALYALNVRSNMSTEQVHALSTQDSPIINILKSLKINTDIYSISELMEKKASAKFSTETGNREGINVPNILSNNTPKMIRDYFKPYNQLLNEEGIAGATLQAEMTRLENSTMQSTTAGSGSISDAFSALAGRANGHSDSGMEVSPLPVPVSNWLPRSAGNGIGKMISQGKQYINDQYVSQVYPYYRDKLANKYPFNLNAANDVALSDFEEFFRVGGVLDQFQTEYVAPFVTTNPVGRGYKLKRIDGATVPISPELIESLYQAKEIRKRLFNSRGDTLNTVLFIRPNILGKSLESMSFQYDENNIVYEHGPIKSRKIIWPSESGNADARFQMTDLENNTVVSIGAQGSWALFKLFNRMKSFPNGSDEIIVDYSNKDYKGSFILSGTSAVTFSPDSPIRKFKLNGHI
ncbi:MAG: type VI secretion system membrane subunit TssM [Sulfuricurvum sp.]|nr:type VI secretion system membrane subunit TssM [Sulfuricurvum sp.]